MTSPTSHSCLTFSVRSLLSAPLPRIPSHKVSSHVPYMLYLHIIFSTQHHEHLHINPIPLRRSPVPRPQPSSLNPTDDACYRPWDPSGWTSSDDRVRGGASHSYLSTESSTAHTAVFHGTLDIRKLGGAGFASQRTVGEDQVWDLSAYDGILLDVARVDGKRYTLTLKDELLPRRGDGREQSTVSWEYDFEAKAGEGTRVWVPWAELRATYRGKEKEGVQPLDTKGVKRFSLMMRR